MVCVFRRLDSDNLHSDTQVVIDDAVVAVAAVVAAVGVHSLAERLSDFSAPCASWQHSRGEDDRRTCRASRHGQPLGFPRRLVFREAFHEFRGKGYSV